MATSLSTATLEEVKILFHQAETLEYFWERYEKERDKTACDKYNAGFDGDNRWRMFNVSTFFECHTGYYGDSNCSRFGGDFNERIVQPAMIKAMNEHAKLLFETAAKFIREDAESKLGKAKTELDAFQSIIDEVENK